MDPGYKILKFLHEAEKLKLVLRHSWLSSGRRESTAEHTWRMALMGMLLHPHLKQKPDLFKTLKMVLMHDIVEVYAGDEPAFKKDKSQKIKLEHASIKKLAGLLPKNQGKEIENLWLEYETGKTKESKFAKALDKLEALIQHGEAGVKYLVKKEYRFNLFHGLADCEYDPFLKNIRANINKDFIKLYKKHKIAKELYE